MSLEVESRQKLWKLCSDRVHGISFMNILATVKYP